jgi:hypothetical protein
LIPLLLGIFIYAYGKLGIPRLIVWYLPDGLWAYSLTSTILLIWAKEIPVIWLLLLGSLFVNFEILQKFHYINGTGDILDVIIYFIFALLSLKINTKQIIKTN